MGDSYLQAKACRALGTLYSKLGRLKEAVETLQRHFQLTKKLLLKPPAAEPVRAPGSPGGKGPKSAAADIHHTVTSQDLDVARAFIGISKGNMLLGTYAIALQSNLSTLLDWKLNRTEVARPAKPLTTNTSTATNTSSAAANAASSSVDAAVVDHADNASVTSQNTNLT